jgi:5-methylcytosine-specific restriction endonuclease McrA
MVLSGRAEVYPEQQVASYSDVWPMPSVVRFRKYTPTFYQNKRIRFNRHNVWLRDKGTCQYCGKGVGASEFTFDHVVPISQGGQTTWDNIVTACRGCNQRKMNRTPLQAGMLLLNNPVYPKSLPGTGILSFWRGSIPTEWDSYLEQYQDWNKKEKA